MEKLTTREKEPDLDFLNEELKVTFEIKPDALAHMPAVSAEDEKSGLEKFGVLLGTKRMNKDGSIHLEIKGVYQETEEDAYGSYAEGVETVSYDLALIKQRTEEIQQSHQEYRDFGFIGDVHTHPTSNIAKPSEADLLSVIHAYESGDLKENEPYVFGIGAQHSSGEMEYLFYRIVKTGREGGYGYKALDQE